MNDSTSPVERSGSDASGRQLGLWIVTALVVGNMIGSGVFLLPASLGPYGGLSIMGWLVSATGAICLALVFARLGQLLPRTGGPYVFAREAFGDFAGFLVAWSYWISIWTTDAALAVAFVSYLTVFWPALNEQPALAASTALGAIWLITTINVIGVRPAGITQLVTTILKLLPLVAISFGGVFFFDAGHFEPFNPSGQPPLLAVSATVTLTLWAFLGLESGTVPAGAVRDPSRTIPRATVLGTLIATAVYITSTVIVMGIIEPSALATSTAPFADAARAIAGPWGAYLVAAGAAISCFGALNGWVLLSGQLPYAAARDGMLPAPLAKLSRSGTPGTGIVISSLVGSALVAMNYTRGLVSAFTFMILLATLATLIPYVFSSMAVLVVDRAATGAAARRAGVPVIATVAFLYSLWAIYGSGRDTVFWGFLLLITGVPLYVTMIWRRSASEGRSTPLHDRSPT
jgi:APA family basic amino acid/polyamine antiporter